MDRQILWDCHMHSSFSADSDTPMEVMIHRAVETGLQGITFTEHLDPDYPVTPDNLDFSLDIPAYKEKLPQPDSGRRTATDRIKYLGTD